AVIDTARKTFLRSLSVERPQGSGAAPVALALSPNRRRLFVADSASDDLAVFALPSGRLLGRIPTAAYPADVQVSSRQLMWTAGKGFGAGANRNGPNPYIASDSNLLHHPGTAVLSSGRAGILPYPSARQIGLWTVVANRQ